MRPHYGIDAPGLVRGFFAGGVGLLIASAVIYALVPGSWSHWVAMILFVAAFYPLGMFCLMLRWSLVVKVKGREAILDLIKWTGSEAVLDIGCGRGLMLVGAAKRLSSGSAIGIDIWQAQDQSTNNAQAPLDNARLEGVDDRVRVQTADMRTLPFKNGAFDVVVSHWVVHNVEPQGDRAKALAEMVRVLRPGGSILLADIVNRDEYRDEFLRLGASDVRIVAKSKLKDNLLNIVSFGSFKPTTILARGFAKMEEPALLP